MGLLSPSRVRFRYPQKDEEAILPVDDGDGGSATVVVPAHRRVLPSKLFAATAAYTLSVPPDTVFLGSEGFNCLVHLHHKAQRTKVRGAAWQPLVFAEWAFYESNSSSTRDGDPAVSSLQQQEEAEQLQQALRVEAASCAFEAGELVRFGEVRRRQMELKSRGGSGAAGAGGCRGAQLRALLQHPLWKSLITG